MRVGRDFSSIFSFIDKETDLEITEMTAALVLISPKTLPKEEVVCVVVYLGDNLKKQY